MRLFIAILFSEEIRRTLLDGIDQLRCQARAGNFTRADNLHATLAFLGEINPNRIDKIKAAMESSVGKPFSLTIKGSGRFGDLWWAGIERNLPLEALVRRLRRTLSQSDFQIESRPFKPHITLARAVRTECDPEIMIPEVTMQVNRISLMKSERQEGRLVYTEIAAVDCLRDSN